MQIQECDKTQIYGAEQPRSINKTSAKIILDSVNEWGDRLTTMEVTFPRMILAEFNTHRKFSRGSASSRAIPLSKQISKVMEDPFVPKKFGANKPGMQSDVWLEGEEHEQAAKEWLSARDAAVYRAEKLGKLGIHKQWVSRLLEPFMWHTAIVSSTEWGNFFDQRCSVSGMAQPEMMELADCMYYCLHASKPKLLKGGEWHTPYIQKDEEIMLDNLKRQISISRCAAVSYLNHDGVRDITKDLSRFHDKLVPGKHYGPFEHVATPNVMGSGNFNGWTQARLYLENGVLEQIC